VIIDSLMMEYKVDRDVCSERVLMFLNSLWNEGLIDII